jgi:hypothetical protein
MSLFRGVSTNIPSGLGEAELERRIESVYRALLAAPDRLQAEVCALRMAELIGQRSPAQIERMEREQGIHRP